jgi:predicted nucleotidyltransferase
MNIETIIMLATKYANEARQVLPVGKVVLYGSYAKGTATEYSDVDLCFFLTSYGDENWDSSTTKFLRISRDYRDVYIEPMVFEVSDLYDDNPFVKEVLRTGIEIE